MNHALVESRGIARTNLFVMATIYVGRRVLPVKIRNISDAGAMVEGPSLPVELEDVILARGSLTGTARVRWTAHGRAGLIFTSPVDATQWLPHAAQTGQQRVDHYVQQLKEQRPPGRVPVPETSGCPSVSELLAMKTAVEDLAADLAEDPNVIARHVNKLQTLDIVAQALTRLARSQADFAPAANFV